MGEYRMIRNGAVIQHHENWKDLELTVNFEDKKEVAINVSRAVFKGQVAQSIRNRMFDGLTGGVGIFEGDDLVIEFGKLADVVYTMNCYLDGSQNFQINGCDEVVIDIKKEQGTDWLNEVADGFSFRYLYDIGVITQSDFVKIPYIKNFVPDNAELAMLGMATFMMLRELYYVIKEVASGIAELVNAATPSVGVGVVVDVGDIIWSILLIIARIIYAVFMVIAIKNLIEEILEQLFPKKKYHLGISFYTLFERACQHLNMTFKSDWWSARKNWIYLPPKSHEGGEPPSGQDELGVPPVKDVLDKFGDFMRVMLRSFHQDYKIENSVLRVERSDWFEDNGTYIIPQTWEDQERRKHAYTLNTDEFKANTMISWEYDTQDQNTLVDQTGRVYQVITQPIVTIDAKKRNMKGLEQVEIPLSRGSRKNDLTKIEKAIKKLAKAVDILAGQFGGSTSYESQINDRVGSLNLSQHTTTVGKVIVMNGDKLAMDQFNLLSAKMIYDECWFLDSFVTTNGVHNQWYIRKNVKVKMCEHDFKKIMESRNCLTFDGKKSRIDKVRWIPYRDLGYIDYRVNEKYTENLENVYVE